MNSNLRLAETEDDEGEWSMRSSTFNINNGRSLKNEAFEASETSFAFSVRSAMNIDDTKLDLLKEFLFDSLSPRKTPSQRPFPSSSHIDSDCSQLGSIFETSFDLTEDRLRRLFNVFDRDNDDLIDHEELKQGFMCHGSDLGMSELDDHSFQGLILYLDKDKSGNITFAEFSEGIRLLMLRSILKQLRGGIDSVLTEIVDYNNIYVRRFVLQGIGQVDQSVERVSATVNSLPVVDFFLQERGSDTSVRWINITGKKASNMMKMIALKYMLHPLALQDALEFAAHKPKADSYDGHYFIMVPVFRLKDIEKKKKAKSKKDSDESDLENAMDSKKPINSDDCTENKYISVHTTSIFITKPFGKTVITFNSNQNEERCWYKLMSELKKDYSKLRHYDGHHLAYRLLDETVTQIGEIVKMLSPVVSNEKKILKESNYRDLDGIHSLKYELKSMSRKFKPFLRLLGHLIEDESFSPDATIYLRDVLDNLEIHDEDVKYLIEKCKSADEDAEKQQAKQMDATLYTLTAISAIILPSQFLTGVWGMNFEYMPELKREFGYLYFWIISITGMAITLWYLNYQRRYWRY